MKKLIYTPDAIEKLQETELYNRRHAIGQIADQKKKFALEMPYYPDAPAEATGVCLLGNAAPEQLNAWEIAPANPY